MAVCVLNTDVLRSGACGYTLGNVVDIYLANYSDVTATALTDSKQEVATITMKASSKFYHIEPAKNSASWSDNLQVGGSNNKYKRHQLVFTVNKNYDADAVDIVDALALGRYIAVAKLSNGTYIMLGRGAGLEAIESDNVTNQGSGDPSGESGITATLIADLEESALPLAEAAVKTVLGESN